MRQKDRKIKKTLFTEETKYVNYSHPLIQEKIKELFPKGMSDVDKAKAAYYFVRDEIKHSFDIGTNVVSVTASECLYNKTGICHVKSNLLAALLRSQDIPTGFCFQHLAWNDTDSNTVRGYVTHGYNAVYLDGKWIKLDARGNKSNVHAEFSLDEPALAFSINEEIGEYNVKGIFASPNMASMHYLENLNELNPGNYTGCNEVLGIPEIMKYHNHYRNPDLAEKEVVDSNIKYKPFELEKIDEVIEFWKHTSGVYLHENGEDNREGIKAYLLRNPGCSFIAYDNSQIVGAVLCGHDGRRGFINHLGVKSEYRRRGIATYLLNMVQEALAENNIKKGALFVLKDNKEGQLFYQAIGWQEEDTVKIFSRVF